MKKLSLKSRSMSEINKYSDFFQDRLEIAKNKNNRLVADLCLELLSHIREARMTVQDLAEEDLAG